jgi:hypothetical protein
MAVKLEVLAFWQVRVVETDQVNVHEKRAVERIIGQDSGNCCLEIVGDCVVGSVKHGSLPHVR